MKARVIALITSILVTPVFAAEMNYPELMVSPKASERIAIEAAREKKTGLVFNLPLQISSSLTLITGAMMFNNVDEKKDSDKYSPIAGVVVGGGWLLINSYLAYMHKPYSSAQEDISALPNKSAHEQLIQERLAEEALNKAGSLAYKLNWFAAFTNFGTSVYMVSKAEKKSTAQFFGGLSALAAFIPLVFEPEWTRIRNEQSNYKKRIYGPLSVTPAILPSPEGKVAQGLLMNYTF